MIRTHKPRGYGWKCASLFQQTPNFRDIDFEDCLADDDTDDFGPSERALKRQRVEKLADDFLNGHELYISSARLPPQGIQHAVARSFARPKDARRAMAGIGIAMATDAVCENVQDHWEILRDYIHDGNGDGHVMDLEVARSKAEEVVVEVHAQASCTSRRRQPTIRLATGPSDEALRHAAALRRSGRLPMPSIRRAHSEAMVVEIQEDTSSSSLQVTAPDIGPTPTAAWTSSKWLNSGMLELRHNAVDEECSKDELGLSSLSTPSQRKTARPTVSLRRGRSAWSQQSGGNTDGVGPVTGNTLSSMQDVYRSSVGIEEGSEHLESAPHVLAPPSGDSGTEGDDAQEDSQAQLLRRQGTLDAPRQSRATFGGVTETPAESITFPRSPPPEESALSPAVRESVQESASSSVCRTLKARRATKSTGAAQSAAKASSRQMSSRRKSAPSESQSAADSLKGLLVEQQRRLGSFRAGENTYMSVPGKDSSPFLFRKRVSKLNNSDESVIETLVVETRNMHHHAKTPNSVGIPLHGSQLAETGLAIEPAVADPKTPLVNEYLNRLITSTGKSGSSSSSVKKALRDEMRLAGAEFSRAKGDPPSSQAESSSSQDEQVGAADAIADECNLATEPAPEMLPPQIWPGTQVLLAEAHKDLFASPNNENTILHLGDKTTPQTTRDLPRRRPLQALSQEHLPMPSTQALLDGWQGWSSIKKPRSAAGKRSSILPSPSVNRGGSDSNLVSSDPGYTRSFGDAGLRKSSLRDSISRNDSPEKQQTESLPVAAFFPAYPSALDKNTTSTSVESGIVGGEAQISNASDKMQQTSCEPSGAVASLAAFSHGHFPSTTEFNAVSSLSLHAGLSSVDQPTPVRQQQQQPSSISFSTVKGPEAQRDESRPVPVQAPRTGHTTLSTEQESRSFSPLAEPSITKQDTVITIEYGTPVASLSHFQQAQDAAGHDASSSFLRGVDLDSQELDFTLTDLVSEVLGSAKKDMPQGPGMFSQ